MSTATDEKTNRTEWLAWRRQGIGASETPAILGIDPYRSPLDVYLEKIGEREEEPANLPCRVGLALEPLMERLYEEQTGRQIVTTQIRCENNHRPFIRATLDAYADDYRIVEFKTTHSHTKGIEIGEEGTDEIPAPWLAQVTHQMIAFSLDYPSENSTVDVAVLRGNSKFTVHTVNYDPDLGSTIVQRLTEFWDRVQTRNPPPATRGSDCRVLAKLYPEAEGETELTENFANVAEMWEYAMREAAEQKKRAESFKAFLLHYLGPHALGRLPDGRILKRSVIQVKERTQTVKASTQVRLTISKGERE